MPPSRGKRRPNLRDMHSTLINLSEVNANPLESNARGSEIYFALAYDGNPSFMLLSLLEDCSLRTSAFGHGITLFGLQCNAETTADVARGKLGCGALRRQLRELKDHQVTIRKGPKSYVDSENQRHVSTSQVCASAH